MDTCKEENSTGANKRKKDRRVRFESFTDRIKRIRIDLLPRSDLSQQVPSERETFFFEGVLKWKELNLTADFSSYLSRIKDRIQTLPLLLHHRDYLLEVTITAISEADEISLEPLLDLSVQLARDLQQDFSPHFPHLFSALTARLASRDPSVLEQVFSCLSHLLKILWRHLLAESQLVCSCYAPLLSASRRDYVQRFAAESLSFLLRRSLAHSQEQTLAALLEILSEDTAEGMGSVLFEMMKGPQSHFHSCTPSLLRALLGLLDIERHSNTSAFLHSLIKTSELMVLHSSVETAQESVSIILDKLSESSDLNDASLKGLIKVSSCWAGPEKCRLSPDSFDRCVNCLTSVCESIKDRRESWEICLQLLVRLSRSNERLKLAETSELWHRMGGVLRSVNNREKWGVEPACSMVEGLIAQNAGLFSSYVLTFWIEMSETILTQSGALTDRVLYAWTLVLTRVTEEGAEGEKRIKLDSSDPFGTTLLPLLLERSELPFTPERAPHLSCLCLYSQRVSSPPEPALLRIEASLAQLYGVMTSQLREETILTTLRDCIETLIMCRDLSDTLPPHQLLSLLSMWPRSPPMLGAADTYVRHATLSRDQSQQLRTLLLPTLSSPYSHVRRTALSIFSTLSPQHATLSVCCAGERVGADVTCYRERLGQLRRLVHTPGGEKEEEVEICLRILVSQFYLNFSPIWDQVRPLVTSYAVSETNTVFWKVFSNELEESLHGIEEDEGNTPLDLSNYPYCVNKWFLSRENEERERRQEARIDRSNYSLQLWRTLIQIPTQCETKSRVLVPIFTRYLDRWAAPQDALQEVGKRGESSEEEDKPSNNSMRPRHKQVILVMLELFSHFKHPKSLYRADTLRDLYLRLLSHSMSEIQTSALSCLVSFQPPHLHTYLDHLTAVAAGTQLSSSLTLFSSEAREVCVLEEEHRCDVVPVLCRVLHGLLLRHGSSERASPTQTAILQFLASCGEEEVSFFLTLTLNPLQPIIQGNRTMDTGKRVLVVPLKKQIAFLSLLKHLFFSLSTQIPDSCLADILTLLFNTCSQCVSLLKNRDAIQSWTVPLLKTIRSLAISRITEVAITFPSGVITSREEELFSSLVTPSLSHSTHKLAQGGPLLELMYAWSSDVEYVQFLQRNLVEDNTTVIGYVINTLGEKGVNKRAADSILEIVSLLLQQDSGGGEGMIAPHMEQVLRYINQVLTAARREKRAVSVHSREMEILSLASKWIGRRDADVLTENLLFFLTSRASHHSQVTCDILTSVRGLVPLVESPEKVSSKLSPLFSKLSGREERQELLAVFNEIASRLPYIQLAVSISSKLNAWKEEELEGLDFEQRGEGFSEAGQGLRDGKFEEESLRILAHNCVHFLFFCDELSLRDMSVQFLRSLVEWDYVDIYRGVISRCVLPAVRRGLKSSGGSTRSESVGLLACITKRFPHKDKFRELLTLVNKDREVDVFENLVHIQLHRRTAAVAKLTKLAETNAFSPLTLRQYLLPLVSHFLHCSQHDREHNLLSNAIQFVGRAGGQMGWGHYLGMLRSYLRMVTATSCKLDESVIIRVITAIIQNFHFDTSTEELRLEEKEGESESEDEQVSDAAEMKSTPTIQEIMSNQILPELEELLNTGVKSGGHKLTHATLSGCEIRAPVALSLVQLLVKLSPEVWESHYPGILLKLVRALHSRAWEQRQEVRGVLREVAVSAGAYHLRGMFSEMHEQLNRGYQVHVLSYSIHSVLEGVKRRLRPGDLDKCVPILCEVALNDLFGRPSEEREVREIAMKTLEVKHPKALDVMELLSSFISPGIVYSVLEPVVSKLQSASGTQVERVREVLKRISQGVLKNRGMTSHKLLLFVHQQLTASLSKQPLAGVEEDGSVARESKYLGEVRRDCYLLQERVQRGGAKPQVGVNANIQVLTEFCLGLLSSALRLDRKVDLRQQSVQEMLDPFIGTLSQLIPSPHLRICTLSVRILGQVSHLPLPSLKQQTQPLKRHLFSYLGRYGGAQRDADSASSDMVGTCFRVMTNLVTLGGGVTFSKEEVQTLLVSVEEDIHHPSRHATVFPLLKAIITSGVAGKALHPVMLQVAKLCVQEEDEQARRQARASLVHFLTERPISRKRLKQCLDFILSNLEYETEPGRQSAARLLTLILRRFPREILNDLAEYFYLPMALALANEESRESRRLLRLALKSLFSRVDSSRMENIYQMGWGWVAGADGQFIHMGVASLFVLIESGVRVVRKKRDVIMKRLVWIVKHKRNTEDTFSNRLGLVCVECLLKMLRIHGITSLCQKNGALLSALVECCMTLVNDEEKDIRVTTTKLFGTLFSQSKRAKHSNMALFGSKDQLVKCAQAFVDRIISSQIETDETAQVVRNLIHLSGLLLEGGELSALKYLVRQMVKKATLEAVLQPRHVATRRSTFQLIAAISVTMDREVLSGSLAKFARPLYYEVTRRNEKGGRGGVLTRQQEEVKTIAQECLDIIKKKVGADVFNAHMLKLQKRAGEVRVKRRSVRSQLAATDPVRFANMKLRKHARQSLARKRKLLSRRPLRYRLHLRKLS